MRTLFAISLALLVLRSSSSEGARPAITARKAPRASPSARLSADAPRETVVAVSTSLASSLQFGYALGALNAPQAVICEALAISPLRWAVLVAGFGPAGLIGAQAAGAMIRSHGAKAVLLRTARLFLAGALLQGLAAAMSPGAAFWLLLLGRATFGLGAGIATVAVPTFLGECAPLARRGAYGSLNQFGIVIGLLCAQLLGLVLSTERGWPYLLLAPAGLALLQLLAAPLLLDSAPRLVAAGEPAAARALLRRIRPPATSAAELDAELGALRADADAAASGAASESVLAAARGSVAVSRALRLSLTLMLAQQLSGINGATPRGARCLAHLPPCPSPARR